MGTDKQPPQPQGRALGIPFDWRRPTTRRVAARFWNASDRRLLTPKAFGWGYTLNLYWLVHPVRYLRARLDGKGA